VVISSVSGETYPHLHGTREGVIDNAPAEERRLFRKVCAWTDYVSVKKISRTSIHETVEQVEGDINDGEISEGDQN
jgi:hypothetical protein